MPLLTANSGWFVSVIRCSCFFSDLKASIILSINLEVGAKVACRYLSVSYSPVTMPLTGHSCALICRLKTTQTSPLLMTNFTLNDGSWTIDQDTFMVVNLQVTLLMTCKWTMESKRIPLYNILNFVLSAFNFQQLFWLAEGKPGGKY